MHNHDIHKLKRKRMHSTVAEIPHPDHKYRFMDNVASVVTTVFPFTMIPQIIDVWVHKKVEGVSLMTWSLFFVLNLILVFYATLHKERKLIIMWSLFGVGYLAIIFGVVLHSA